MNARLAIAPLAVLCLLGTVGRSAVVTYPSTSTVVPRLACSTTYGCEVQLPPGEAIVAATSTDPRIGVQVLSDGSKAIAARLKILPSASAVTGPDGFIEILSGEIDVLTNFDIEYHVIIEASDALAPRVLQFVDPRPIVLVAPRPTSADGYSPADGAGSYPGAGANHAFESSPIDPASMDFAWSMAGDAAHRCAGIFSVLSRGQLWCKLQASDHDVPSAYLQQNGQLQPLNARVVGGTYFVVETLSGPIVLKWADGRSFTIERGRAQ